MAKVLKRDKINPAYIGVQGVRFVFSDPGSYYSGDPMGIGAKDFSLEVYAMSYGSAPGKPFFSSGSGFGPGFLQITSSASTNDIKLISFEKPLSGPELGNSINLNYPSKTGLHHIVITRKGTLVTVYINGETNPDWSINHDRVLDFNNLLPRIGYSQYFRHMRVFSSCLSKAEVLELANNGRPDRYSLGVDLKSKCMHEYIPSSASGRVWRDVIKTHHMGPSGIIALLKDPPYLEVETGNNVPSTAPKTVGLTYFNSASKKFYLSTGINSINDWVEI